jgi:hypothetical protein
MRPRVHGEAGNMAVRRTGARWSGARIADEVATSPDAINRSSVLANAEPHNDLLGCRVAQSVDHAPNPDAKPRRRVRSTRDRAVGLQARSRSARGGAMPAAPG